MQTLKNVTLRNHICFQESYLIVNANVKNKMHGNVFVEETNKQLYRFNAPFVRETLYVYTPLMREPQQHLELCFIYSFTDLRNNRF